ncbi:glycosyltransferase family 4 protein [Kineococcus glutinatus]|uniref:Glycosyltransferase family 4 protein n=1 Tax=Kineococcus glutinatus TaxID=1070872 RepID=A0ABP8VEB4_9ACTN
MSGVVVLTRGLPHHRAGGMESVAWDVSRALAARGEPVVVLTTSLPGRPAEFVQDGVRVRALPAAPPGRYSRAWWRSSRRALHEELHRAPGSAVLSVSAAAFGCLDLAGGDSRFVLQAHGTSVMELRSKLAGGSPRAAATAVRNAHGLLRDLRSYRRFDAVVAVGPSVAASLGSFPLGRWAAMPPVSTLANGVDTGVFRPDAAAGARLRAALGVPAPAHVLLAAGRLHPQKRVDRAVRCLHALALTAPGLDPHLLVVGGGPQEGPLRALAARLGVARRVRFTGPVAREDLPAHYAAADVSLLTSPWREGLPMSVLESLACGTPAITSLTTAPVEGAEGAVTRVEAADTAALAAAAAVARPGPGRPVLLPGRYDLRRVAQAYSEVLHGRAAP